MERQLFNYMVQINYLFYTSLLMKININDVLKYYMIPLLKFYKLYRKIARRFFEYKK